MVGEDNVIGQREVQESGSLLHLSGESVIVPTGTKIARWMIMAEDKAGSPLEQGLAQDKAYVDHRLGEATHTDAHRVDNPGRLVEQQHMALLDRRFTQILIVIVVDLCRRTHLLMLGTSHGTATAQFASRKDGDGLGGKQVWPNRAACWSPAAPAMGILAPKKWATDSP